MILKRLILVLLAVFLVMGCVGAVSADDTLINSLTISGITQPFATSDVSIFTPSITIDPSECSSVTVSDCSWITGSDTPVNGYFEYSTEYKARFTVSVSGDYNFSGTTIFADIGTPTISVDTTNNKTATITITYPKTTAEPVASTNVSSVSVAGIPAPIAGGTPVTTASLISDPTGKAVLTAVSWAYSNGTEFIGSNFGYGTTYIANITLSTTDSYTFNSSTTYAVENATVDSHILSSKDTRSVVTCIYSATSTQPPTPISSVNITGVTAPVYGATPVTSAESSTTGINSVSVSWTPTASSTFAADTTYKATIVAQITDSRYAFNTSTPSVSLNGATTSTTNVTRNSDTQITITYTFPKTESQILPTITLSANVTSGTLPLSVKFTYTVANATSKSWTYGDSSTATLSSSGTLNHTYTTAGTYTANLTATNANGTVYKTVVITVKKVGLVAGFQVSALSGTAPLTVRFTDTSVGTITSRIWNFGDGTSDNVANPTHTITSPGSYKVILTISDGAESDSTYRTIIVKAPVSATPTMAANLTSLGTTSGEAGNLSIIPHPFDIIKEFMHLFYSIFDPVNYVMTVNES
ncbi:MAG: hypothetical protein ALMCE001_15490 [Methanocorpusculum sp. MCE]|nr:MAG: hypothetical protein ALMCE001_15490 [Methanocorpusculum sp. MCE]